MLDVHAPHESIHTWKSFFIHIAAIAVGLLIAVTLEQSVEYLHHRHQLHKSREALRSELVQDKTIFEHNIAGRREARTGILSAVRGRTRVPPSRTTDKGEMR
jgi:hypothetical protein